MTLLVLLLLLVAPARASTLAVLPLDRAAASEEYDGLGKALAGMLVTDLSKVPGLELVERDRLAALMEEMQLAESGFLDPATAQELGNGLGARFVLTGSYSVIAETWFSADKGVTAEDFLALYWAYSHARWLGSSPELRDRTERMLRRVKVDPTKASEAESFRERYVLRHIENIVRDAGNVQKWERQRGGLTLVEAKELARALAEEDATVFDPSPELCRWSVEHSSALAASYVDGVEDIGPNDWMLLNMRAGSGASWYPVLARSGCVVGVEAEFETLEQVIAFGIVAVQSYERGAGGICDGYVRGLEQIIESVQSVPSGAPVVAEFDSSQAFNILTFHGMAEAESCFE